MVRMPYVGAVLAAAAWYESSANYLTEAIATHPYYAATLAIGLPSLFVAALSAFYVMRQATETKRLREQGAIALEIARTAANAAELQAHAAGRSLQLMQQQGEDTKRAAYAAVASAEAARQTAATANASMEIGSRAWITVSHLTTINDSHQLPTHIQIVLKNSGVTPALDVHYRQSTALLEQLPSSIDFDIPNSPTNVHPPVGNGGEVKITSPAVHRNYDETQLVLAGGTHIVFLGAIKYRDIFGVTHQVNWYYRYFPHSQEFVAVSHLNTAS
jgi:alkylhydroperoxidase/carboxymuconolactone decarboxylase family protein YurZ